MGVDPEEGFQGDYFGKYALFIMPLRLTASGFQEFNVSKASEIYWDLAGKMAMFTMLQASPIFILSLKDFRSCDAL